MKKYLRDFAMFTFFILSRCKLDLSLATRNRTNVRKI